VDYTPKHLAEKILQSKSALEGERKQVTVLFADVEGSMEMAEQLDPEEWRSGTRSSIASSTSSPTACTASKAR
jgi:class 3 adenylate cyclase